MSGGDRAAPQKKPILQDGWSDSPSGLEIAGLALLTMTLVALGSVAQLPLVEYQLHPYFAAACAEELLGDNPDPRVFAQNLGHGISTSFPGFPLRLAMDSARSLQNLRNTREKSRPFAPAEGRAWHLGGYLPPGVFLCMMGPPMKIYRGLLLDADNTLFDYEKAESLALEETLRPMMPASQRPYAAAAYRSINAAWWTRFEQGSITAAELKVGRFADLIAHLGLPFDPAETSARYLARLSTQAPLLPHAKESLAAASRVAKLCLVTNGISQVQRGRLAAAGITAYFSAVLISEELGIAKPDPRFFHAASDALGIGCVDLLCIGDNPAADIAGARAAGIDACWFAPAGAEWPGPGEKPHIVLHDLRNIVNLATGAYP
jgi:YjjG family noncanonical pyrimidine nucleotidase